MFDPNLIWALNCIYLNAFKSNVLIGKMVSISDHVSTASYLVCIWSVLKPQLRSPF